MSGEKVDYRLDSLLNNAAFSLEIAIPDISRLKGKSAINKLRKNNCQNCEVAQVNSCSQLRHSFYNGPHRTEIATASIFSENIMTSAEVVEKCSIIS